MSKIAIIESSFYGSKIKVANQHEMETRTKLLGDQFELVNPPELVVNSNDIIPAGLPIGSSAFIVDKVDVAFYDGKDYWRRTGSSTVARAGQHWYDLF